MDHVNEFEHGLDIEVSTRNDSLQFSRLANEQFRYSSAEELLNTPGGKKAFRDMLTAFFEHQKQRLRILDSYAKGNNYSILSGKRRMDKEKEDNRVSHRGGGYI